MRAALALIASTALLTGCATLTEPAPDGPPMAQDGNDCAVIAAVAKEHFRFGSDNPPPPIRFAGGYAPQCDWGRYGLDFTPYVDDRSDGPVMPWVSFERPRYDGEGALIEVGAMDGQGSECRVRSGFAGWTVTECRAIWVS
ncbi:MAG TPA: hypothetical protein VM348_12775 [Brevundimonas sp.]|nr:hypothetical protein [Brevundimonas sp.]